jgi:hypothetical protein
MNAMTNDAFAEAVLKMSKPQRPFEPAATYIPAGDCIEFVWAPDDYRALRLDGLVTVYYSRKTNQVVGGLIKGVRAFCEKIKEKCPGFRLSIAVKPTSLEYIFLAQMWTEPPTPKDETITRTYEELIAAAKQQPVNVDIGDVCQATG